MSCIRLVFYTHISSTNVQATDKGLYFLFACLFFVSLFSLLFVCFFVVLNNNNLSTNENIFIAHESLILRRMDKIILLCQPSPVCHLCIGTARTHISLPLNGICWPKKMSALCMKQN